MVFTETSVSLSLKCADFISSVDPDCHVTVYAIATVKETGQTFLRHEPLWIEKPHIELKVRHCNIELFAVSSRIFQSEVASALEKVKNVVGGDSYHHFLLLTQCYLRLLKTWNDVERFNT